MKFLWLMAAFSTLAPVLSAEPLLSADMQTIVSRADLDYDTPARRSEEGIPIGNGRMGSLVWTTPIAAHLQINADLKVG